MSEFTYEYLPHRNISKKIYQFYDVKTKIDKDGKPIAVGFKYPNNSYKVRLLDTKDFYTEGEIAKGGLFGRDRFSAGSHKYVAITEGEFDALALHEATGIPCVSVQSSGTGVRDCSADREWLNSFERIYLAFDGDEKGRECARRVAPLFDFNKVYHVKFDKYKDANDYLIHNEKDELRNLYTNARKYLPETVISSFNEFEKILADKPREGAAYPFRTVNEMTYGIRTSESVLLTAQEGVGKTEVMHAILHKLLRDTNDNVAAIFLEEPKRRLLEGVAGLTLEKPAHIPDSGVSSAEVISALKATVREDDRLHVYSHFGSDDPDVLLDTIRFLVAARSCRYVLLDHISMVVSGLAGEDERRALDYLSTRLEMMVKELDFALILVAHVNDDGKTRGSRYISKVADIRIDLYRDLTADDPVERNTTYLTISKNRFCGKTGSAGTLVFDPVKYKYQEEWNAGWDLDAVAAANDNGTPSVEVLPDGKDIRGTKDAA